MNTGDMLVLTGREVLSLLNGCEKELIHVVRMAYETHARGDSSLPHSTFLRFPGNRRDRIIALPTYLGGKFNIAGLKWIASFPGNLDSGLDRASAVLILNSPQTGVPEAILEGAVISTKRTAASAVLAAQCLQGGKTPGQVGFIGCGLINYEIATFLMTVWPNVDKFIIFDIDMTRANRFRDKCQGTFGGLEVDIVEDVETVLKRAPLISIGTTATQPHIFDLTECAPGSTILHISLRDLSPEAILMCDNVVDDVDHVCRAQTSVHLAEQIVGARDFIRCTLAGILTGSDVARKDAESIAVFSPFGLGVLDIAIGQLVRDRAIEQGYGLQIASFLPAPWARESGEE